MDALILSVGTGGGHNAAGYAVKEELEKRGHHAVMLNPYDLKKGRTSKLIDNSYIRLVQVFPKAFGFVYYIGNAYRMLPWRSPVYFANRKMAKVLKDYLLQNSYDIIIMPHLYPAEIVTNMRSSGYETPKTLFVATDYTCTPFVEETNCDAYVCPDDTIVKEYMSYGIPSEKLIPLGIPSLSAYSCDISKEKAKASLGLDITKKYILVTGGSMGSGSIVRIVCHLTKWCEEKGGIVPIVVCGSNTSLYKKITSKYKDKVIAVGYTDKMPLYMKACELFMTKPGGLSTTEAAVSETPIIHITPIPGCETKNMEFFANRGMSISAGNSKKSIFKALLHLDNPKNRLEMIEKQKSFISKNSASRICDLAEQMCRDCDNV